MIEFNIKKILVPTDFSNVSNSALQHAQFIAKPINAEVELLHVVQKDVTHSMVSGEDYSDDYYSLLVMEAKIKLRQLAKLFFNEPLSLSFNAKKGIPGDCIVETATESSSNLIVMGYNNERKGTELSPRVMNIVRRASCPIIAVQPEIKNLSFKKIILPIRNQPFILDKLNYAISLAKSQNASVYLVVFYPHFMNASENSIVTQLFEEATNLLKKNNLNSAYTCIMGGNYVRDTIQTAIKKEGNLIVILSNQSGFFKRILGLSDEEKFIKKSPVPIMTIPIGLDGLKTRYDATDNNNNLNPVTTAHYSSSFPFSSNIQ